MENRLKIRVSRMFRSSFGSCRTRNFSDVMEKAVFAPHYQPPSSHLIEPRSPRLRPFPSIFRPKSSETSESLQVRCFDSFCDDFHGRSACFPASRSCEHEFGFSEKVKESARKKKDTKKRRKSTTTTKKKNTQMKINQKEMKDEYDFGGNWWYSSDDDDDDDEYDETETLFSSKSSSSDSSRSRRFRRRHSSRRRNPGYGCRVSSKKGNSSEMDSVLPIPAKAVKVKDSFAVVKRSSDPYNDFRTSMVEMIVERQIFAPGDLDNLLQCFLSLNSYHHHKIIVEVFTEIYDALFL